MVLAVSFFFHLVWWQFALFKFRWISWHNCFLRSASEPAKWTNVYVVVNFLSQVIFVFLLLLGLVMYANEVETKENEKLPKIKN